MASNLRALQSKVGSFAHSRGTVHCLSRVSRCSVSASGTQQSTDTSTVRKSGKRGLKPVRRSAMDQFSDSISAPTTIVTRDVRSERQRAQESSPLSTDNVFYDDVRDVRSNSASGKQKKRQKGSASDMLSAAIGSVSPLRLEEEFSKSGRKGVSRELESRLKESDAQMRIERKMQLEQTRISDEQMIAAMSDARHSALKFKGKQMHSAQSSAETLHSTADNLSITDAKRERRKQAKVSRRLKESSKGRRLRQRAEEFLQKKEKKLEEKRGGVNTAEMLAIHGVMNDYLRESSDSLESGVLETEHAFDDRQQDIGTVEAFLRTHDLPVDFEGLSADLDAMLPADVSTLQHLIHKHGFAKTDKESTDATEASQSGGHSKELGSVLTANSDDELDNTSELSAQKLSQIPRGKQRRLLKLAARKRARQRMEEAFNARRAPDDDMSADRSSEVTSSRNEQTDVSELPLSDARSFDVSLRVWDDVRKCFSTVSAVTRQRKKEKLSRVERRRRGLKKQAFIVGASPHWLAQGGVDWDVFRELGRVLQSPAKRFAKSPKGLYQMRRQTRERLQRVLVSEYWPKGWHEKKEDMEFAQRLFNAVPNVKWERRKVLRYMANEFPLSLAVNYQICKELKHRMPGFRPTAIVDFGSGVGAASMAALQAFNADSTRPIRAVYMVEPSTAQRDYCKAVFEDVATNTHMAFIPDLSHDMAAQPLVIASFVLSEIGAEQLDATLDALWLASKKVIVIVESGTPDGFSLVSYARSYLLSKYPPTVGGADNGEEPAIGTYTIAPCPHDVQCPLGPEHVCRFISRVCRHTVPSRCHFKATKQRTKQMDANAKFRKTKRESGEIQFPFSYCVLGKGASPRLLYESRRPLDKTPPFWMDSSEAELAAYSWPRLITPVKVRSQHLYLNLCLPKAPSYVARENQLLLESGKEEGVTKDLAPKPKEYHYGVCDALKVSDKKYAKRHFNVDPSKEGLDAADYGFLQRWAVTRPKDRKLQQWQHAKHSHWGDLWPWPSPALGHYPTVRKAKATRDPFANWQYLQLPTFEKRAAKLAHMCRAYLFSDTESHVK